MSIINAKGLTFLTRIYFIALLCLLFMPTLHAAQNITPLRITSNSITKIDLTDWLHINTSKNTNTLEQLIDNDANKWTKVNNNELSKIGAENYWVGFSIFNPEDSLSRIIAIDNPLLYSIKLYHVIDGKLVNETHMGDTLPFGQRPLQSSIFLYPFELKPGETHTFYLKIDTTGSSLLPLVLWSSNDLTEGLETQNLINGLQIGMLLAIGLFSLIIAFASGSFSYSYYGIYVLGLALFMATLHGVSFRYLWPQTPILQQYIFTAILPLIMGFSLMFTEKVLQLKYNNLRMLRVCRLLAAFSFSLCLILPFIHYSISLQILVFSIIAICLLLAVFSIIQVFSGLRNAALYAFGRLCFLIGAILSSLIYLGFINISVLAKTPAMIGVTLEVITMAIVLAIRFNDERKAKQVIQQEALEQAQRLRETRDMALTVEEESNEKLESMVQERTLELEITLRELNEVNQKLTEQNTIDSLTGVKNRSAFDRRLIAEGRISRRQQTPIGLLMIDIDKFKSINDRFGHLAGDYAIQVIARTISDQLKRPTDIVARFGGEEFAIILPNTTEEGAMLVAETIREAIEQLEAEWNTQSIPLAVSIGVNVAVVDSDEHPTLLLEQADKALYQAKRSGRNQVRFYSAESENS